VTAAALVPLAVVTGVLGLAVGSFLNVVVYRVPAGLSVVHPASACPRCDRPIRRYDNVPVLSWFLLRGRCRDCGVPISSRYPLVEAVTSLLVVLVTFYLATAPSSPVTIAEPTGEGATVAYVAVVLIAYLYLMAISIALALIDLDTHTLPNGIVLPAYVVVPVLLTAASAISGDWGALLRAAVGLVVLGGVYLTLALAVPGGMGLGDVKLAGLLGFALAYLGWGPLAVGSFGAFVLGGTFAIALMIVGRAGRRSGIPFGPWMLAGAWVGIAVGPPVWTAYLGLLGLA
jgi:leader peptidase (prepilin peptidase)/N-methyltransferase